MTDPARSAVYAAEAQVAQLFDRAGQFPTVSVAGSTVTLPTELRFGTLQAAQHYVDHLLRDAQVRSRWPDAAGRSVTLRVRRGQSRAHYEADTARIALPPPQGASAWALRELVVLHEVAHHLGAPADLSHGAEFLERLLFLLDLRIGPVAGWMLRVVLADQGIRA